MVPPSRKILCMSCITDLNVLPQTYSPLPNKLIMKCLPDKLQKSSLPSVSGITVKQRGRYMLKNPTVLRCSNP